MNLEVGKHYPVVVSRFSSSGVIVKLQDNSTELIHLSKISNMYVRDASDYLNIGDTLDAICVEGVARPEELSIKHLNLSLIDRTYSSKVNHHTRVKSNTGKSSGFEQLDKPKIQTLDDMIAESNKQYNDKFKGRPRDNTRFSPTKQRKNAAR